MEIQLIRHATLVVKVGGFRLLVDPMLSDVGVNPPIQNSGNDRRNPLVPLPIPLEELLEVDAVLVTHTHRDHFDEAAVDLMPSYLPVLCQPEDEAKLRGFFETVYPVQETQVWNGIRFTRTGGQHGTGEIGQRMGPVSGFVIEVEGEPVLYIAGDTIWCADVQEVLDRFSVQVAVVNAGAAQFTTGDPITMTADDVITFCHHGPQTQVVAVHMDSINHCLQTRTDVREQLAKADLLHRVYIPADGETLEF